MKWHVACLCDVFKYDIDHLSEFAIEGAIPTEPVVESVDNLVSVVFCFGNGFHQEGVAEIGGADRCTEHA
eukprot:scaffold4383_cov61-Cyclotella_meneghiniana.AAC.14